jgi:pyruvate formate lyase activating enzyme
VRFYKTISQTYETLKKGVNVVIFPEDSTNGYLDELEGFHDGFLVALEYCYKKGLDVPVYLTYFCKQNGIHTAVDTAGNVPFDYFEKILPYTDLFLYDVKCFSEDLHKEGTGVSNRLILENLQKLSEKNAEIIVRIPVIPEFNDKETEMQTIANFLKNIRINKVELLPYHAMGEHKWSAIGKEAEHFTVPNSTDVDDFKKLFNSF